MVDIKNLRVGMLVIIRDDISLSIKKFGNHPLKLKMAGTIQTIKRIKESAQRIYMDNEENITISFHINDLEYTLDKKYKIKKIKPIMFDPEQLYI